MVILGAIIFWYAAYGIYIGALAGAFGIGLHWLLQRPVISRNGIYTQITRPVPRQRCENPLLGLSTEEIPLPCIETTFVELANMSKAYAESIIAMEGLTQNEFIDYVNELFDGLRVEIGLVPYGSVEPCPGWETAIDNLSRALPIGIDPGLPLSKGRWRTVEELRKYLASSSFFGGSFTDAQKLDIIQKSAWQRGAAIFQSQVGPWAADLANKAYPYERRTVNKETGELIPSCNDFNGVCCLYDEYTEVRGRLLPEKKKWFKACIENTDEAFCKSQTKQYDGQYDGYTFYANGPDETDEPTCRKCSNETYHIVYCAGTVPSMVENLSLSERQDWYTDNAENIESGYYTNVTEFIGKISLAQDEIQRRLDTDSCSPATPTVPPTEPTEPTVPPTEPTMTIMSWDWPAPE